MQLMKKDEEEQDKLIADVEKPAKSPADVPEPVAIRSKAHANLFTVFYCAVYLLIGPTLIVVNRHIMKELHFNYPMCLSGLGLLFTTVVCVIIVQLGWVELKHRERITPAFALKNLLPVGAAMACTLSFGNAVYLYLPVGYIQMLKAFTPTVTLTLLWLSGIEAPSRRVTLSVAGICVGTGLASLGEGSVTVIGLVIMLSAEVSEAVRLVLAQKLLQNLNFGVRRRKASSAHCVSHAHPALATAVYRRCRLGAKSRCTFSRLPVARTVGSDSTHCTHGDGATCPSRAGPLMGPPPELGRPAQIRARDDARAHARSPARTSRRWWRVSIGWHRSPLYVSSLRLRSWSCRASCTARPTSYRSKTLTASASRRASASASTWRHSS